LFGGAKPTKAPRGDGTAVIDDSTNQAGMKKAASIFLTPRKFITAKFNNKCVATPCGTAEEHSAYAPDLDLKF